MKIGILALQGAFVEHAEMLQRLDTECFFIRNRTDLETAMDGLILPGGESTVMNHLLETLEIKDILKNKIKNGLPVFGTCAGLLLLAGQIRGSHNAGLKTMDISARRNAYGRQLGSFKTHSDFTGLGQIPMVFIRAPYIETAGPGVTGLASVDGNIVAARQNRQLVTAFHPELTGHTEVHEYFLKMILAADQL